MICVMRCIRCKAEIEPSFKACPHCGEPVTDFLRRYLSEPIDGKYELVERLGAGRMGDVYKVRHTILGSWRVIKLIRPQISESQDAHDRFLREARMATRVQHPNVATLHDFSALPDGSHYMVWEFIDGENLAQRLRARGTLPPRIAIRIAIEALAGLEAIHRAGIVHRDISPENLMLARETDGSEHVKIIDLGVAKSDDVAGGTRTGMFVGKFRYASPEHVGFIPEGEAIDGRADLYSLAIVLYEMLSGRPPFEATSPHEYILLHSHDKVLRPIEITQSLPGGEELQRVLQRALERDRNKRFPTARAFATALEEVARQLPDQNALKTMAGMPEADATMRQPSVSAFPTTAHETARATASGATVAPTLRTPVPAAATVRTETRPRRFAWLPLVAVIVVIILVVGAAVWIARRPAPVETAAAGAPPSPGSSSPATTRVDVTQPAQITNLTTAESPALASTQPASEPTASTQTAAPAPAPTREKPAASATREPEPRAPSHESAPPRQEPESSSAAGAYIDGQDAGSNDAALAAARRELSGESRIAVEGSGLAAELRSLLSGRFTIDDGAAVTIHFNGSVERLRLGRKRREAHATITKNGRTVFRYVLPPETYRVGDDPAEAFSRVLEDVFGR
jgi:serine/threonine-protein kinase